MNDLFNTIKTALEAGFPGEVSIPSSFENNALKGVLHIKPSEGPGFSLIYWLRFGLPNSTEKISLIEGFLPKKFLGNPLELDEGLEMIGFIEKQTIVEIFKSSGNFSRNKIHFCESSPHDLKNIVPLLVKIFTSLETSTT